VALREFAIYYIKSYPLNFIIIILHVPDEQDVVEIDVDNLDNPIPSDDGGCQFVNKTQIEVSIATYT
jgi:hypothetical protein